jgi:lysophospholipase L1-like esterase
MMQARAETPSDFGMLARQVGAAFPFYASSTVGVINISPKMHGPSPRSCASFPSLASVYESASFRTLPHNSAALRIFPHNSRPDTTPFKTTSFFSERAENQSLTLAAEPQILASEPQNCRHLWDDSLLYRHDQRACDFLCRGATSVAMKRNFIGVLMAVAVMALVQTSGAATVTQTGYWQVRVTDEQPRFWLSTKVVSEILNVTPSEERSAEMERYDSLPVFQPTVPVWAGEGVILRQLKTQETSSDGMLVENSLKVFSMWDGVDVVLKAGVDYGADLHWAAIGRLTNGAIQAGQPVFASYKFYQSRLDAVVRTRNGAIALREGAPTNTLAKLAALQKGDTLLATIWVPGRITKLTADNLFPILETKFPENRTNGLAQGEKCFPKTLAKLRKGESVRILAWGDSVTDGGYLPHPDKERWQAQFLQRLQKRFPRAHIELVSEGWGGRTTASFLAEPPGSPHNYREKVLAVKPDLIVSEFVNDAGLPATHVHDVYPKIWKDFQEIGAEWIILTPHYVRPDWMGLTRERDIDNDPRPYVAALRNFAPENSVGLADAAKHWGRLWRQGVPYTTMFMNSINHPDPQGMAIFADSLMELFP